MDPESFKHVLVTYESGVLHGPQEGEGFILVSFKGD